MAELDEYISVREAADQLGLSIRTVLWQASHGHFAGARKLGDGRRGIWLIPKSSVVAYSPPKKGRPIVESQPSGISTGNTTTAEEEFVREVNRRLRPCGDDRHFNKADPFDELLFIILSAQTESYSYVEVYKNLRRSFATRYDLLEADEEEVASAIKRGGLAQKKARQIKGALQKIQADTGKLSLAFLSEWGDERVEAYLLSLPGIGIKSAKCIMMYSLGRKVFPVDTHVWRISRRLGLVPGVAKPTPQQERDLEAKVPSDIRYTLHINMVTHGRITCTPYRPRCGQCALGNICPSRDVPDEVWIRWRDPKGVWATTTTISTGDERRR